MNNKNTPAEQPQAIYGIMFMMLNTASLSILDISAKILRSELNSSLIVFIYKFSLFLIILPWIFIEGTKRIKTQRLHFHILRSLFGTAGTICFVHGLKYVTMADAAALENIQYILVICLGLVLFGDKLTKTKLTAIALGFLGALVVVRPELIGQFFDTNYLITESKISEESNYIFILLAISFWAANTILVKILGNTEHNKTQMFYLLLFASIWSFPAAFIHWDRVEFLSTSLPLAPSWIKLDDLNIRSEHILFLALMAACYFTHGVAYFKALKSDLSVVIPFRYTKLIFSALLGYMLFGEVEDQYSYIGYCLIISASLLLLHYEMRKKLKKKHNSAPSKPKNLRKDLRTKEV